MDSKTHPHPAGAGGTGGEVLWKLLRHGSTQTHGTLIDVPEPSVEPLWIDPAAWAFYAAARPKTATNARGKIATTRSAAQDRRTRKKRPKK